MLHVVKNYTGDVLNFQLAAELADDEGIKVETVLVDDDVAVQDSLYTAGRRGTGGTVVVEKVAGALAERAPTLDAVAAIGRRANEASRSFGIALTPCITPAAGTPTFELGPDEIEIGIGIHGEPGRERRPIGPASELAEIADRRRSSTTAARPRRRRAGHRQRDGRHPADRALHRLRRGGQASSSDRGITVARSLVGNYVTSLEMAGCMLTLTKLDAELTRLWDAPVSTPGLRWGG